MLEVADSQLHCNGKDKIMGMMGTRLKLSKEYTIEELYELIKDIEFEPGHPSMANYGPTKWIVFPQLNRYNQVVIGGSKGKFYVQRTVQPISVSGAVSNAAISSLTKGWSGLSGVFGKTKRKCEKLAESVGRQINEMNL